MGRRMKRSIVLALAIPLAGIESPVLAQPKIVHANTVTYEGLAREPAKYKDATVSYTGQVVQTLRSRKDLTLRVKVRPGQRGIWEDTVHVEYRKRTPTAPHILEKDIVTFSGKFVGIKSYTAGPGQTFQMPHVIAHTVARMPTVHKATTTGRVDPDLPAKGLPRR